jgi:pimeloyl-ACP methyl ester carboxylesterase
MVVLVPGTARAVEIADFFRPYSTERAALAPDGRHLAYTVRENGELRVLIVDLETNRAKTLVVAKDEVAVMSGDREKTPSRITFLRWATDRRLIFSVEDLTVWGVDADGKNPKTLLRARDIASPGSQLPPPAPVLTSAALSDVVVGNSSAGSDEDTVVLRPPADASVSSDENDTAETSALALTVADQTQDVFESDHGSANANAMRPYVMDVQLPERDCILVEGRRNLPPTGNSASPNSADLRSIVYKVNINTGRILSQQDYNGASRVLCDQQGKLRLAVSNLQSRRTFIHAASGFSLSHPLDAFLGGGYGFEFSPQNFFERRSFPLGFDRDPNVLYYASNCYTERFGIYAVNLATKKRTDFAVEHRSFDLADINNPFPDDVLVMDRAKGTPVGVRFAGSKLSTSWLDPELGRLQVAIEKNLPEKTVEILEWDDTRTRFLVLVSSQTDPGAFYVYDRAKKQLAERARRAPWLKESEMNPSAPFSIEGAGGVRLNGFVTLPQNPRRTPIPLLVFCHDGPWNRDLPGFNRGAQALASLGFAVLQVNFRGSSGFGRAHLAALQAGFDRVALEDVLSAVDHFSGQLPVSRKLVAILGNGYGGYLALRALELYPSRFKCAVAMNAPSDLEAWLAEPAGETSFARDMRRIFIGGDHARLAALSPVKDTGGIAAPVLVVHGEQNAFVSPQHAATLRRYLGKNGAAPQYLPLPGAGHADWLPGTYAKVFAQLGEFFNETIFTYTTEVGPAIEVK